ncbi:MAG: type 1 glutamine amidotransferase domain-containing protein [Planctomycetaceae bacterium]
MRLTGKKAIVLVDQLYQELEVWYPLYRLREEGVEAILVGPERGATYPSKVGYPAVSDQAAADVAMKDYHCLVIPGGYAPDHMRRHRAMVQLVIDALEQQKVVAAICHAGWMLCSAPGGLRGRRVTSFFAIKDDMVNAGAEWVDAEVVRDRNLITSRKPDDLPAFMRATIEALCR